MQSLTLLEAVLALEIQEERKKYGLAKSREMLVISVDYGVAIGQDGPIERWPIRLDDAIRAALSDIE